MWKQVDGSVWLQLILICFQIFKIVTEGVADKVLFFHEFKLTFVVSKILAKTNLLKNLQDKTGQNYKTFPLFSAWKTTEEAGS